MKIKLYHNSRQVPLIMLITVDNFGAKKLEMVSINLKCWTRYRYSPTCNFKINKVTGSKY